MNKYKNLGGNSSVDSYQSSRGRVSVKLKDGTHYTYTRSSAGPHRLARMRHLARQGRGLNRYINKSVKKKYESKS